MAGEPLWRTVNCVLCTLLTTKDHKSQCVIDSRKRNKKAVLSQRWPRDARYISGSNEPLRRYGHSKLSKMAACRQLRFDVTGNSAIRSADPENPTLEPNMKCIGSPVAEIWPFAYLGGIWKPHFGGRRCRRGSAMAPFKRAMAFPIGSPLWPLRYL